MSDDIFLEVPDGISPMKERIFAEILTVHEAHQQFNGERSRAGWWIGGIGAAIGLIGMATGGIVAISHQPQVRYTEIDDASGVIRQSFGAKDAPEHFNDRVVRHYLAEYVTLQEQFVWQMDSEIDHRVKLMSSPAEQQRYATDKAKNNPAAKYGLTGYARISKFVAFTKRGTGKDKTTEFDVQFVKAEVLAASPQNVVETHMTARVIFAFHPEIPMSDPDRLDNEAGLYVISYSATVD